MKNGETKEIAKPLPVSSWNVLKEQATVMLKSGFLPTGIKTAEQAMAIGMAGRELGIGLMEAVRSIHIIQGKPTISPQLMLALANRSGQLKDLKMEAENDKCVVTVTRKGRSPYTCEFGKKEADDLGLSSKDNYRKQPKIMYQWRALAANLRVTFPDVVSGLYTPEELGAEVDVDEEGVMEVKALPVNGNAISLDEQKSLFSLLKDKNVDPSDFKRYLEKEHGISSTKEIHKENYSKITEWIIKNARALEK